MELGKVVKKAMIDKDVTYEQVSNMTGFTLSKVGRIANGNNTYFKDACVILDCLGLQLTVSDKV